MLELRIKPQAEEDLAAIYLYTANRWSVDQAEKYQDDLFAGMLLLTSQPDLGKAYEYGHIAYRKLHVNRHLIFYRIQKKDCLIIRVLHDRVDIQHHLVNQGTDL